MSESKSVIDGLDVYSMDGSKTEGELTFIVEGKTLITGDLIRAHSGGKLCLVPDAKLQDAEQAKASAKRVASIKGIDAILTGDGWPVFRNGEQALSELIASI